MHVARCATVLASDTNTSLHSQDKKLAFLAQLYTKPHHEVSNPEKYVEDKPGRKPGYGVLSQNANTLLRTCFSCTMGLSHDDRNSSRAARVLYWLYVFALGKKIVANNCGRSLPIIVKWWHHAVPVVCVSLSCRVFFLPLPYA